MNYLAHIRLAGDDPECLIGNFLGDFVKGRLTEDRYSPGIRRGIAMHRRIDAWTDSHEITRECARLISPERRRWSRVILDIFYDHLLAVNWERYSDESLRDFLDRSYAFQPVFIICETSRGVGYSRASPSTASSAARINTIIKDGWIEKYRSISGLSVVFQGMSIRVRRKNPLSGSERELVAHYDEMNGHFNRFFPEILEYAKHLRKASDAPSAIRMKPALWVWLHFQDVVLDFPGERFRPDALFNSCLWVKKKWVCFIKLQLQKWFDHLFRLAQYGIVNSQSMKGSIQMYS